MRIFVWVVRAAVFFALLAFALNNQQTAALNGFFGQQWQAPIIIFVLIAFACGCVLGMLAMVPSWWRHRRVAKRHAPAPAATLPAPLPNTVAPSDFGPEHPPREGL